MKIAICLSGMMRNFENTHHRFKKYIMDQHSPDIFFSGYPNKEGYEYCKEKLINFYNPKKYILNTYNDQIRKKICNDENKYQNNKRTETVVNNFLSQIYNIKLSDQLRIEYEKENNFFYDVVVRSRMDVYYFKSFEENELNIAKEGDILIPDEWDFKIVNKVCVSDSFAMSNSKNMELYSSLYDYYNEYYDSGVIMHPETMFGHHLNKMNLKRFKIAGHGWYKFENIDTGKESDRNNY
jgi:hypothetical protein